MPAGSYAAIPGHPGSPTTAAALLELGAAARTELSFLPTQACITASLFGIAEVQSLNASLSHAARSAAVGSTGHTRPLA
jgi:hypothetical protein